MLTNSCCSVNMQIFSPRRFDIGDRERDLLDDEWRFRGDRDRFLGDFDRFLGGGDGDLETISLTILLSGPAAWSAAETFLYNPET
jgi:hypothetical protein